jgi:hypothetical protein
MVYIDGIKYACERCIRGHRVTTCKHTDQPLTMIKPKGRPATQCAHCREHRKLKSLHVRCICGPGLVGAKHLQNCPCAVNPDMCSCAKNKYANPAVTAAGLHGSRRRTASNPPPTRKRAPSLLTSMTPVAPSIHSPVSAPARSISTTGLLELGKQQAQQFSSSGLLSFNDDQPLMSTGLASQLSSNQQHSLGYNPIYNQPYLSDFASGASSIDSDHEYGPRDVVPTAGSTSSSANISVIPDDEYLQPIYGSDTVITSLFDPSTSLTAELATIVGETPALYDAVEGDNFLSALSSSRLDQLPLGQDIWASFDKSMISM